MCGLAGIISTEKTAFNINHFNILGTLNDERGGDSCGIFIDGQTEYGIGNKEMFRCFTSDIKYPKFASIALLHCRKASPGYPVNIKQAQPIIIKHNNKTDFVLMHNGTISNITDLSKKYLPNVDTYGLSDSQILAQIIYKHGYDVLEEYTGCAVLIMIDYRPATPKVLIFKGSSCYNEAKTDYERPLYYMINDGKFYFSSMFCSLYCINNKKVIYNFPTNQLCEIENNTVYLVKKVDRTKLTKSIVSQTYYTSYGNTNYNSNNYIIYDKVKGIYMLNGVPAHGKYNVYPSGYVMAFGSTSVTNSSPFYFFQGRLLYNGDCFYFLKHVDDLFDDDVLLIYCPEIIDYFSYSPRTVNEQLVSVNENFVYIPYTNGSYVSLFNSPDSVQIVNKVITKDYIYPTKAVEMFNKDVKAVFFDFDELEKQIMSLISNKIVNLYCDDDEDI